VRLFDDIDPRSPTPIYDQIAASVRVAVAAGELEPESTLPSVRQLAARLRINPATVAQAYRLLETEGFVDIRQGAGTFVKDVGTPRLTREREAEATRLVRQLLVDAGRRGLSVDLLAAAFRRETDGGRSR
jgi:GntR family transcriptional regulator